VKLSINGEQRELDTAANLAELISELGLAERRVAVELNRKVIRRECWIDTKIVDNDEIEIVQFVGGG